jgi:hypothetical protein
MTNEEVLQQVLNATVERLGKQAIAYEAEIANLHSQIVILHNQINNKNQLPKKAKESDTI